jgi:hypothetical protein
MQARLTTKPEQEVIAAIRALDLESVKLRVTDAEGWTREYADSVEVEYKNYLAMVVKYQEHAEDILLSKNVDEFWHAHILHTMKYTEDCERVFGKYLHHNPQVGKQAPVDVERKAALTEKARRLYQREFEAGNTAMCSVAIHPEKAAMCSIAVRPEKAAMCSVAVHPESAAMCSVAAHPEKAAMCSVAVHPEKAAMCSVAVYLESAAMCSVAIQADNSPRANPAAA